ncbi:MAG: domain containing protein [Labilithrix sp.]|jgi:hypothetical protein|nr:domain containing protein [Labilithrix sp.]
MNAMSHRRDSRSPGNPEGTDGRRPRTFLCRDDLYGAFERRAHELECSVDWLVGEAMKRLLADAALKVQLPAVAPLPPLMRGAPLVPPPPPPPRPRRATGSFVGEKAAASGANERLALRLDTQRVVVDRDRFVIGRSARDAQLALRDGGVSRQHAIIERTPGGWVVIDMASTNGIHVNGTRVTRAPIRAGDTLEIGPFTIAIERA